MFWLSLLTNSTNYFEWGSGSTTIIADKIAKSVVSFLRGTFHDGAQVASMPVGLRFPLASPWTVGSHSRAGLVIGNGLIPFPFEAGTVTEEKNHAGS